MRQGAAPKQSQGNGTVHHLTGTGMRGGVHLSEPVDRHQCVDLGGGHRGVAEQFLHHPNVGAAVEKVGCERMAQHVRGHTGQTGPVGRRLQDLPGALPGQPGRPGR